MQPTPPATVAARALLDELVRLGLRHLVLSPGSRSAPLAYAAQQLDREGRLRLHVRVDERAAGFLALGLAKVSRVPAAVVTTSGTAVANLHPAVLEAHHGEVPLLVLSADRPPELRGVGANQATDQPGLLDHRHCRLVVDVETPSADRLAAQVRALRSTAARAVAAATGALGGDPGPVHLDLPYRDPLAPPVGGPWLPDDCAGRPDGRPWVALPTVTAPTGGGEGGTADLVAPRTLAVVGDLATRGQRDAALAWAGAHDVPVLAETGPGAADAPTLLPHGALALAAADWVEAHRPERLVLVGRTTLGRSVAALARDPRTEVHVVSTVPRWADPTHEAAGVHPFAALAERSGPRADPTWARDWADLGRRVEEALVELPGGSHDRLTTGAEVVRVVDEALPTGARLFLGSSSVARDHQLVARPRVDVDVVVSRGLAGIDGCVSTAAGLALADPGTPTYAAVGDLTFLHDSGALLVGPSEPVPDLTVVVLDDRGGSIFATLEYGAKELEDDFERVFATPTGTDVAALVRAHGWPATTVTTPDELRDVLAPAPGLRVVVVPLDLGDRRATGLAVAERLRALG